MILSCNIKLLLVLVIIITLQFTVTHKKQQEAQSIVIMHALLCVSATDNSGRHLVLQPQQPAP
jgi:hypothetical protein